MDWQSALLEEWLAPWLGNLVQALQLPETASTLFASLLGEPSTAAPPAASPSTPTVNPPSLDAAFQAAAQATGLSPALLKAVANQESGGNPAAVSPAGAIGVMQLMPATAAELGVDPYDASANIMGGARYLASLLHQFGSLPLALAAYNAGPGAVEQYGGIPPYAQTQRYVAAIEAQLGSGHLTLDA